MFCIQECTPVPLQASPALLDITVRDSVLLFSPAQVSQSMNCNGADHFWNQPHIPLNKEKFFFHVLWIHGSIEHFLAARECLALMHWSYIHALCYSINCNVLMLAFYFRVKCIFFWSVLCDSRSLHADLSLTPFCTGPKSAHCLGLLLWLKWHDEVSVPSFHEN